MRHAAVRQLAGRPSVRLLALAAALLVAGLAGVALATGDGSGATARHEAARFSFEVPAGWRQIRDPDMPNDEGGALGRHSFGLGRDDFVGVDFLPTAGEGIGAGNVAELLPYWTRYYERFAKRHAGRVSQQPRNVTVAGLPAIEYEIEVVSARGVTVVEHLYRVFDANDGWVINCRVRQEAPAATRRAIAAGCAQAAETFEPRAGS